MLKSVLSYLNIVLKMIRYNLRIVFGGNFIWFVVAAYLFFIVIGGINAFSDYNINNDEIYGLLLFPVLLLVFYPAVFGIQNDADARTMEIIFGIPDYRFKVWLIRLLISIFMAFLFMLPMTFASYYLLISFNISQMIGMLIYPMVFISCLSFGISTWAKNGNATAALMIIIGFIFFILQDTLKESMWNIFLNPYNRPSSVNDIIWQELVYKNQILLISVSVISVLSGLIALQKREKFLK